MFELKRFLDEKANQYNQPSFIGNDPIAIPHLFAERQDREIAGLFAALLAWGQRKTILAKSRELMGRMGNEPFRFVREHGKEDLRGLLGFKHRTFNDTDRFSSSVFFKDTTLALIHWRMPFCPGRIIFNPSKIH